ncbi:DNA (cytosine-5-)-methyltransferase [Bacillus subtilis]|uniref:DNA (cytosine-5-)-methyltransferase n=1 Tax=Bacillus subtilis TaxID=1423 RepID=UPI001968A947|nr:DNA (cytosine-5-)-methyltransferase [Bacillus subtilis]MEC0348215.1 DNA (cytosine-5-)-methyltransferase [Bacillus subtilis]MEC0434037.1 DNA (cytosine-5-)-methyltransferase [Bacillus subtilis]
MKMEGAKSRGGVRKGAGRKRILDKKIATQIYLTSTMKEQIEMINIDTCKNFSQKCNHLIRKGIEAMLLDYNKTDLSTDTIKYIDLFAGMGGLRLGFEQALHDMGLKGESVFVSEIKKHAIEAYKKNFPNEEIHGDITQIDENTLPDFDYVLAGFPCQAFSSAGNRLGFEDTRGTLFFDVARIIKKKQPKGFLLENVEGLVTHDGGNTLRVILSTLEELGYKVNYKVLDSQNFGLAQSRKRIYIVGARKDIPNLDLFEVKKEKLDSIIEYDVEPLHSEFTDKLLSHYTLEDVIGKQIKDKRGGENNIHSWDFGLKGEISEKQKELLDVLLRQRRNKKWASIIGIDWMDGMPLTVEMISTFYEDENLKELLDDLVEKGYLAYEYPKKKVGNRRIYDESLEKGYNIITGKLSFEYSKILDPNGVTPTLVATDVSKLAVPVREGIRPLTTREGLKLFGFPDSYSVEHLDKTKVFDLLGNTVCVPVVKAVARRLLKVDF